MRRFYRRRFLNRRGYHAGAYVLADICLERSFDRQRVWLSADLTVADCGRIATLDFDISNQRDVGNALHKARLLRDVIVAFTDALEDGAEQWARENGRPDHDHKTS